MDPDLRGAARARDSEPTGKSSLAAKFASRLLRFPGATARAPWIGRTRRGIANDQFRWSAEGIGNALPGDHAQNVSCRGAANFFGRNFHRGDRWIDLPRHLKVVEARNGQSARHIDAQSLRLDDRANRQNIGRAHNRSDSWVRIHDGPQCGTATGNRVRHFNDLRLSKRYFPILETLQDTVSTRSYSIIETCRTYDDAEVAVIETDQILGQLVSRIELVESNRRHAIIGCSDIGFDERNVELPHQFESFWQVVISNQNKSIDSAAYKNVYGVKFFAGVIVVSGNNQGATAFLKLGLQRLDTVGKNCNSNRRHDRSDSVRLARCERRSGTVGDIRVLFKHALDPLAKLRTNGFGLTQHTRDRCDRDFGLRCDIDQLYPATRRPRHNGLRFHLRRPPYCRQDVHIFGKRYHYSLQLSKRDAR